MTLSAILFGSIGTLVETSEHQRAAFNAAFRDTGLDWNWNRETYMGLLAAPGGANRIASYAKSRDEKVDASEVHRLKTQHFEAGMEIGGLEPRPGVLDVMRWASEENIKTAFVTSTSRENIEIVFKALGNTLTESDFDLVTDATMVQAPKPAPDIYHAALQELGVEAGVAVAIEDTEVSLLSSLQAKIASIAFPGANSLQQDYSAAQKRVSSLSREVILAAYDAGHQANATRVAA